MFFFFKQKTAYEMRISDWSSDVCSSDRSSEAEPAEPATHPTGARHIDHVVVLSPDLARTTAALEALGVPARGERDTDSYGAPMRQVFFRLGAVILEVVGQPDTAGAGDPGFFGLALTVDDLHALAARVSDARRHAQDTGQ